MKSKKDKWMNILTDWENSGLIRTEYCRQRQIPVSTFDYWRQRIRQESQNGKKANPLVKLPVVIGQEKLQQVVFEYPSGYKIHIPSDCSTVEIKRLATAFQELF